MAFADEPTEVLSPPATAPAAGALLLGRYRLEERIGSGGSADVWSARDARRDRRVTIKVLRDRDDPVARQRFLDEGLWLEAIEHRGIVRALGRHDVLGLTLIVFEYVEGVTLSALLARGPLPPERATAIVGQVAAALGALHAHGLLHLDLKPANILVGSDGRARLIDLGIADLIGNTREVVMGTPAYAAPEVRAGKAPTRQADIYGLALIARDLLGPLAQDRRVAAVLRIGLRADPSRRPASATRFAFVLGVAVALAQRLPGALVVTRRLVFGAVAVVLALVLLALPRIGASVAAVDAPSPSPSAAAYGRPALSAYAARFEWQAPYPTAVAGAPVEWVVALRNTGTAGWYLERDGARAVLALLDGSVVGRPTAAVVAPGGVGIFLVHFTAPAEPGTYVVRMRLVIEGTGPSTDLGLYANLTVTARRVPTDAGR